MYQFKLTFTKVFLPGHVLHGMTCPDSLGVMSPQAGETAAANFLAKAQRNGYTIINWAVVENTGA